MARAMATTTPGANPLPPLDLPPTKSAGDAPPKKLIEVNPTRPPWEFRGELNLELRITVYFWFNSAQSPWEISWGIEPGIEDYGLFLVQSNPVTTRGLAGN